MARKPSKVGFLVTPVADPPLYVLRDEHTDSHGERWETLHVMSRAMGGQVRGYVRRVGDDTWHVHGPAYEGHWPEIDRGVSLLLQERVSSDVVFH